MRKTNTITPEQWKAKAGKKPNKWRNEPVTIDGIRFDSKAEGAYYRQLCILRDKGKLTFERQTRHDIKVNGVLICRYLSDFVVTYTDGKKEVIDVKGKETPEFKLKKKLMKAVHGIDIVIVKHMGNGNFQRADN